MSEEELKENKTCLECGQPLGPGRRDRKYCDDICRTAYNNRRRADSLIEPAVDLEPEPRQASADQDMAAIGRVYDILLSNRTKLINIFDLYERRLSLEEFQRFGLNLNYFTSEMKDDYHEKLFRMCFDYGYHVEDNTVYVTYSGNEIHFN